MAEKKSAWLRTIYAKYVQQREQDGISEPVSLNDIYDFARQQGWREPRYDPRARFRRDMAKALREDHFTDMKGRTVRRYHAKKRVFLDSQGLWVQEVLWDDMLNDPPPKRLFMDHSFQQRRSQVGGELHQLKTDIDHYNDRCPDQTPIKMLWDFTYDMRDKDQPAEYTVPPMED